MKRLVVVLMVLSMATLANAALQLTISGPQWILPGGSATYTVGYTGGTILGSDVDIVVDYGTIGGGVILTDKRDHALDFVGPNPVGGNYEVAIINDVAATDLGSPLFSFQVTSPAIYCVQTITLIDNGQIDLQWNQVMDAVMPSFSIVLVPEPMTIGLLALGGLFLRRRKL